MDPMKIVEWLASMLPLPEMMKFPVIYIIAAILGIILIVIGLKLKNRRGGENFGNDFGNDFTARIRAQQDGNQFETQQNPQPQFGMGQGAYPQVGQPQFRVGQGAYPQIGQPQFGVDQQPKVELISGFMALLTGAALFACLFTKVPSLEWYKTGLNSLQPLISSSLRTSSQVTIAFAIAIIVYLLGIAIEASSTNQNPFKGQKAAKTASFFLVCIILLGASPFFSILISFISSLGGANKDFVKFCGAIISLLIWFNSGPIVVSLTLLLVTICVFKFNRLLSVGLFGIHFGLLLLSSINVAAQYFPLYDVNKKLISGLGLFGQIQFQTGANSDLKLKFIITVLIWFISAMLVDNAVYNLCCRNWGNTTRVMHKGDIAEKTILILQALTVLFGVPMFLLPKLIINMKVYTGVADPGQTLAIGAGGIAIWMLNRFIIQLIIGMNPKSTKLELALSDGFQDLLESIWLVGGIFSKTGKGMTRAAYRASQRAQEHENNDNHDRSQDPEVINGTLVNYDPQNSTGNRLPPSNDYQGPNNGGF